VAAADHAALHLSAVRRCGLAANGGRRNTQDYEKFVEFNKDDEYSLPTGNVCYLGERAERVSVEDR
jgi:hypothetical protein